MFGRQVFALTNTKPVPFALSSLCRSVKGVDLSQPGSDDLDRDLCVPGGKYPDRLLQIENARCHLIPIGDDSILPLDEAYGSVL